mmetsp:Transcript_4892/g.17741  ORF Transcript_4892/g.17741 Transcript_4892/m.17741 type:complete len:241 (-) Transcript_4892:991-1713(-)
MALAMAPVLLAAAARPALLLVPPVAVARRGHTDGGGAERPDLAADAGGALAACGCRARRGQPRGAGPRHCGAERQVHTGAPAAQDIAGGAPARRALAISRGGGAHEVHLRHAVPRSRLGLGVRALARRRIVSEVRLLLVLAVAVGPIVSLVAGAQVGDLLQRGHREDWLAVVREGHCSVAVRRQVVLQVYQESDPHRVVPCLGAHFEVAAAARAIAARAATALLHMFRRVVLLGGCGLSR